MPIPKITVILDKVVGFVKIRVYDALKNAITSTVSGTRRGLDVNVSSISGGITSDVNISDAAGNALTSTAGSLDVREDNSTDILSDTANMDTNLAAALSNMPSRRAKTVKFTHGSVTADYAADDAGAVSQSASFNFIVTAVTIKSNTDPTLELQSGPLPISLAAVLGGIEAPGITFIGGLHAQTHFEVPASTSWLSRINLGGATALDLDVYFHGYEVPV